MAIPSLLFTGTFAGIALSMGPLAVGAESMREALVDPADYVSAERLSEPGPVEKELVNLLDKEFATPVARQQVLDEWREARGAMLKSEVAARRERDRPALERLEAEAMEKSRRSVDEEVTKGNIGALEGEFIKLMQQQYDSPLEQKQAIEGWRKAHGAAMAAEREQRLAADAPKRASLREEAVVLRGKQIDEALLNGDIGPREAQLMRFQTAPDGAPAERAQAFRMWLAAHGAELRSEQEARRQPGQSKTSTTPDLPLKP